MAEQRTYDLSILNQFFQDINPLTCGWENCNYGYSFGPAAREYYLIHYILSGKGVFKCGGVRHDLGAGSLFLIRPEELTFYQADSKDPWSYVWIGFTGSRVAALLESSILHGGQAAVNAPFLGRLFDEIKSEIEMQHSRELFLCAKLFELFAQLQQSTNTRPNVPDYVLRAIDYMKANYTRPINIGGIASLIGIDRRYFGRIFALETGQTPKQYLMNLRLERAACYLTGRNYTVSAAARGVGYEDVFNFSKMFKQHFGMAPQVYRQMMGRQDEAKKTGMVQKDLGASPE